MTLTPELRLLARMCYDSDVARVIADAVDPGQFQDPRLRALYVAMVPFVTQREWSVTSLTEKLAGINPELNKTLQRLITADKTDGSFYESVENTISTFSDWAYSQRLSALLALAHDLSEEGKPAPEVRGILARELDALDFLLLSSRRYDDLSDQHARLMRYARGEGKTGLAFGFASLDRRVTPLLPGNLIVVAGAPGTGKSTIARNFARNWITAGRKVVLMSLEMPGDEQLANFACMDIGMDYGRLVRQELQPFEIEQLDRAAKAWVDEGLLTINERISAPPDWILRQMKRYRADGADLFVVDHVHHVDYGARESEMRIAVSNFMRSLKSFASEHDAIVLALSQYAKMDKHMEPDDNNVKESNTIAEVADKILHVFRPRVAGTTDVYGNFTPHVTRDGFVFYSGNKEAPNGSVYEPDPSAVYLKIGKQRVRPVSGIIRMSFNERSGRINEPALQAVA